MIPCVRSCASYRKVFKIYTTQFDIQKVCFVQSQKILWNWCYIQSRIEQDHCRASRLLAPEIMQAKNARTRIQNNQWNCPSLSKIPWKANCQKPVENQFEILLATDRPGNQVRVHVNLQGSALDHWAQCWSALRAALQVLERKAYE